MLICPSGRGVRSNGAVALCGDQRHEALLGATVATASFVAFQCLDLKDSLPSQVASILILVPVHHRLG